MGDTGPTPVLYTYNITGGAAGATYGGTGAFVQISKFTFPGTPGPFPSAHYAINWTLCEQVSPVPDASQVYIEFIDDALNPFMPRIIGTTTHPNFGAVMTPVSTSSGPWQLQTVSVADFVDLTAYDPTTHALNCFIYQRGSTGVVSSITLNQYYMSLQFMPIMNPTFSA
jgi:hypothetical protein